MGTLGRASGSRRPSSPLPKNCAKKPVHLLDTPEQRRYHILRPNKYARYLRRNHTTQGNQPGAREDSTP